ncbi:hypothetical protein ACU4HD_26790 [Cupriavidus basilensis]
MLAQERAILEARLEAADSALAELARARDEASERAARAEAQLLAQQADNDALRATLARSHERIDTLLRDTASQRAAWDKERETMSERFWRQRTAHGAGTGRRARSVQGRAAHA